MHMELDRARWQVERERWQEEERRRGMYRPFWGAPQRVSDRCLTYGTREYTARLVLNMQDACQHMPIVMNGEVVGVPHECMAVRLHSATFTTSVLMLARLVGGGHSGWSLVYPGQ